MEVLALSNILPFFIACLIIELTPGPNMGYLAIISAKYGRKTGFCMVLGILIGLSLMGLISLIGVGSLIVKSDTAYNLLKFCGAAYMLYLAYDAWRINQNKNDSINLDITTCKKFFMRGFITNILNPKAAIFYVTLLPSFITQSTNFHAHYLLLMTIFIIVASTIHSTIVLLASNLKSVLNEPKRQVFISRTFAVLLVLIAIWIVWSK